MRVLMIGDDSAFILARELRKIRIDASFLNISRNIFGYLNFIKKLYLFDVIVGVHMGDSFRFVFLTKFFSRKPFVLSVIGGDGLRYAKSKGIKKAVLKVSLLLCDKLLFVTEEVRRAVGIEGNIFPMPIDTKGFRQSFNMKRQRDILYYCPRPDVYRLDWIIQYAEKHPDEKITILGCSERIPLENVLVIPWVSYEEMPNIYRSHKRLVRMTLYDGHPKMIYEALLCGCEVTWNGKKITEIPSEMRVENAIPRLMCILEDVIR